MLRSHLDSFVEISAVENVEATDVRNGIQQWAVPDHRLAVADADGRRLADRLEYMACSRTPRASISLTQALTAFGIAERCAAVSSTFLSG
jgi:hypothetical protein